MKQLLLHSKVPEKIEGLRINRSVSLTPGMSVLREMYIYAIEVLSMVSVSNPVQSLSSLRAELEKKIGDLEQDIEE